MELLMSPDIWMLFLALTSLEIVLGIDNVVFLSIITEKLPEDQARHARQIGLALALVFRVLMLFTISWIIGMKDPVVELFGHGFSIRDFILLAGGIFLIMKATQEVHGQIEGEDEDEDDKNNGSVATVAFSSIVMQIVLIDGLFSIDSIITAVGMAESHIEVMVAAVVVAIGVMYLAVGPVSEFIERHPSTKMLALTFLMLIGVALVADGFGLNIPRGYIYAAMAFAAVTEIFNIMAIRRKMERRIERKRRARLRKT
ncbi:MAG: TerC family protein [Alphaproteobacteria bacterium]